VLCVVLRWRGFVIRALQATMGFNPWLLRNYCYAVFVLFKSVFTRLLVILLLRAKRAVTVSKASRHCEQSELSLFCFFNTELKDS